MTELQIERLVRKSAVSQFVRVTSDNVEFLRERYVGGNHWLKVGMYVRIDSPTEGSMQSAEHVATYYTQEPFVALTQWVEERTLLAEEVANGSSSDTNLGVEARGALGAYDDVLLKIKELQQ